VSKFIQHTEKWTDLSSFQLGYVVGCYIIEKYLPTLDIHIIQFRKSLVIQTEPDEFNEFKRLSDIHNQFYAKRLEDTPDAREAWDAYLKYMYFLEKKHLPSKIECYVPHCNPSDEHSYGIGISSALWESDGSCYGVHREEWLIENNKMNSDEELGWGGIHRITLHLDEHYETN
jgi:hypothetical protein